MSLFGKIFSTHAAESVAFVEIGADSIGGAYARFETGQLPKVVYTRRVPFTPREGEAAPAIIARALEQLGEVMVREGAPALGRVTGSGTAHRVVVSIAVPWQEAGIRVEKFESAKPFTFTRALLNEALEHSAVAPPGKVLADESVIATVLNGYEMSTPFGKKVSRASVVVLAAAVDQSIAESTAATMRSLYHTHKIEVTGFTRAEYAAIKMLFPHEEEYLVIEARGETTNILLVKRNCLVGAMTIPPTKGDWIGELKSSLDQLAKDHPLPHTTFLLCDDASRETLKQSIADAHFETLWLSEGPPRVIPVTPEIILPLITLSSEAASDLFLFLLMLSYAQKEGVH